MSSQKADNVLLGSMGQFGIEYVSGAASGTAGPWLAINVITAATFTTLTITGGVGTFTGVAFPAGAWIYGPITAFTMSGGTVFAYRGAVN